MTIETKAATRTSTRRRTRPVLAVVALTGALLTASLQGSTSAAADDDPGLRAPVEGPAAGSADTAENSAAAERAAARAEGGGDVPWQGYAITETSRAASGWIGARRIKRGESSFATVYRTDPTRTRTSEEFDDGHWVSRFQASDSGPLVSAADTACAAQLLGRFGTTADPLQVAGLDVAVYHLLYGRDFTFGGAAQRARTDEREDGPTIRGYGRKLIVEYCPESGPYKVTLTPSAKASNVGDTVGYTATIKSRSDVAMADREISVQVGASGESKRYKTNSKGQFKFNRTTTSSGPFVVTLITRDLPYTRVRYFSGTSTGASRIVQAGLKMGSGHVRKATVKVKGQPVISGELDRKVTAGRQFRVRYTITKSYPVKRTSTTRLYGPYSTGAVAQADKCSYSHLLKKTTSTVWGDTTYHTPALTVSKRGIYVWRVDVDADPSYNRAAKRCGQPFKAS
jgi:hypothetical protein